MVSMFSDWIRLVIVGLLKVFLGGFLLFLVSIDVQLEGDTWDWSPFKAS